MSCASLALRPCVEILASELHALPADLAKITTVLPPVIDGWCENILEHLCLGRLAHRVRRVRRGWRLFRAAPRFEGVVTTGDLEGLSFAALQYLLRKKRPVHVMSDCLWYGKGRLHRTWIRFCLRGVDRCIVWASVECDRYARAYGVQRDKFAYVPHHHTMHHYKVEERDLGFIFTGGNADRDYGLFFDAIRDLNVPCILATNRPHLLAGLRVPLTVQIQNLSPAEFRQRMAEASIVVMPMRATLLHAGAQQSILNAMLMGKPVVLTDPEGGSDYIKNGKTGLLVPYGDVNALHNTIRFLLEHAEERREMGERARPAARPLTTERSNTLIWTHTLDLIAAKHQVPAEQEGHNRSAKGKNLCVEN